MALRWLLGLRQSLAEAAPPAAGRKLGPSSFDLGHCPDCTQVRMADSLECSHCGSSAAVAADA